MLPLTCNHTLILSLVVLAVWAQHVSAFAFTPQQRQHPRQQLRFLASASPLQATSQDDLDKLTVPVLKERLRAASLPVSGRKADLVTRLLENGETAGSSNAEQATIAPTINDNTQKDQASMINSTNKAARQPTTTASTSTVISKVQVDTKKKKRNPGKRERLARRKWACSSSPDDENSAVETLLEKRDVARREASYRQADAILDQLRIEHGVYVDDDTRTYGYRSGGNQSPRIDTRKQEGWTRRGGAKQPLEDSKLAEILASIRERDMLREMRDFDTADAMRAELLALHGVSLDDKNRVWWTGALLDGAKVSMGGWKCVNNHNDEMKDRTLIEARVREREDARKSKDYHSADNIRDELMDEFGVHLDDGLRMWWTSPDGSLPAVYLEAKRGDGGKRWDSTWMKVKSGGENVTLSDEDNATIGAMVMAREDSRRKRNYAAADRIREDLRRKFNVYLDDVDHTWGIEPDSGRDTRTDYD